MSTLNYSDPQLNPKPQAVGWFYVYSGAMALLYFLVTGMGIVLIAMSSQIDMGADEPPAAVLGGIYSCVAAPFFLAFLVPFVTRRSPWRWIYDLVLICLGLTSLCCMPASIPLLIFYLKPEVKAAYGRFPPAPPTYPTYTTQQG
jgi:hypothetical protein